MEEKQPPRYRIVSLNDRTFSVEDADGVGPPKKTTGFQSAYDAVRWIERRRERDMAPGIRRWGEALLAKALKDAAD